MLTAKAFLKSKESSPNIYMVLFPLGKCLSRYLSSIVSEFGSQ